MRDYKAELKRDKRLARNVESVGKHLLVDHSDRLECGTVHVDGLSLKTRGYEVFVVLRGLSEDDGRVVSFVTAETWQEGLAKVSRIIGQGQAQWRSDKFANGS